MKQLKVVLFLWIIYESALSSSTKPSLYPRSSESREVLSLDGIWDFALTQPEDNKTGFANGWFNGQLNKKVMPMPVPASYNDITEDKTIRDFVGIVWYEKKFFVPKSWSQGRRVWIRFGSVCYTAHVWINGELVATHEIGHLPFQEEVTHSLKFGEKNTIIVAVDNTLLQTTVPQGTVFKQTFGNLSFVQQTYSFDFFNYAGIDRSVFLYTTPKTYISDFDVKSTINNPTSSATVHYSVNVEGNLSAPNCKVSLWNKDGSLASFNQGCKGALDVRSVQLWWPYLMSPTPGYLYTLQISVTDPVSEEVDTYRQAIGIRTIKWSNTSMLINDRPIYVRGFGKHEDSDIRGKGLDLPLVTKDYNLIRWIGANAYRTSHYPYAEEIMDFADEQGIMIIDECPSVNTYIFSDTLLDNHIKSLTELIQRDKNRPSVIMWSIANEPLSHLPEAAPYFQKIVSHVKKLDVTRPVSMAISRTYGEDKCAQFLDVIMFNRYISWYSNIGMLEIINDTIITEGENWHKKFKKPIMMSEYGADTIPGLHMLPEYVFSEEFQTQVMAEHFKAFDTLRSKGFFIGEMIWNFADFMTMQSITRVGGNKKGVFTRQRQPKASAHLLRKRYWKLAALLDGIVTPKGVVEYTAKRVIRK